MRTKNSATIKADMPYNELLEAIKRMTRKQQESLLEDLLALTSAEYLDSIKEARADYKAGRVKTHKEIFGKAK